MIPRTKAWNNYRHLKYYKYRMVDDHRVEMPNLPENPKDVFFIDEKEEDAFWDREKVVKEYRDCWWEFVPYSTRLDAEFDQYDKDTGEMTHLNKDDSEWIEFALEREVQRRTEGVFIKVKDEILWIPGDMWFILMWCKMKVDLEKGKDRQEYPSLYMFQLDFVYLVHHTFISDHIIGLFVSKPKKTGITNLMWLIYLNRVTITKNSNIAAMNIDKKKAVKTFSDYFMFAFNGLPLAIVPQVKTIAEADGKISFGRRSSRKRGRAGNDELGSSTMCVATLDYAFDVDKFFATWYDEPPKYDNFRSVWDTNKSATQIQDVVVGKIFLTSYTPEDSGDSFMACRELFNQSELSTIRTDKGELHTTSKLICYHIASHKSWKSSIDKYGYCNEKDAYNKIMAGRDRVKENSQKLMGETRKYAMTKKEAWSVGGSGSVFDPIRLAEIYENIATGEMNKDYYTPGNLKWEKELWNVNRDLRRKGEACAVYFQPLTEHERLNDAHFSFKLYYDIPSHMRNIPIKLGKDEYGNWLPPKEFYNILGADPTQHAAASEVIAGSKNCYVVKERVNIAEDIRLKSVASGRPFLEYFDRPESPDDSYDDILKMIIYTGALSGVEANASTVATRLMADGMGYYMMVKNDKGVPCLWKPWMGMERDDEKSYHLLRATNNSNESNKIREDFVRLHKSFIKKPYEGGKDYGATIKSKQYIDDLMNIDIRESSKKYDTFMAWGWMFWTEEQYELILIYHKDDAATPSEMGAIVGSLLHRNN